MTGTKAGAVIDVRHLHKVYGQVTAVDDVSFSVAKGEIFGYAAAAGLGVLSFYVGMFFAGLYLPRTELPAVVDRIGDWTPTGAAVDAIHQATQTGFPSAAHLLVLTGYALVSGAFAIRFFSWE
jgi:hypothetical protein